MPKPSKNDWQIHHLPPQIDPLPSVFNAATYTGGPSQTIQHGLGWQPQFVMIKKTRNKVSLHPVMYRYERKCWYTLLNTETIEVFSDALHDVLHPFVQRTLPHGFVPKEINTGYGYVTLDELKVQATNALLEATPEAHEQLVGLQQILAACLPLPALPVDGEYRLVFWLN